MLNPLHLMRKTLLPLALLLAFGAGYAFHSYHQQNPNPTTMKRVTGIGGIFFKCKDPQQLREWYKTHLGLETNEYGSVFEWYQGADSTKKGFTQWSPFKETTKYFEPSEREFMINYRVADLEALVDVLRHEGVTIVDTIETYDYGKFVHILDAEGNKLELWEPNDVAYEKMGIEMGAKTTK